MENMGIPGQAADPKTKNSCPACGRRKGINLLNSLFYRTYIGIQAASLSALKTPDPTDIPHFMIKFPRLEGLHKQSSLGFCIFRESGTAAVLQWHLLVRSKDQNHLTNCLENARSQSLLRSFFSEVISFMWGKLFNIHNKLSSKLVITSWKKTYLQTLCSLAKPTIILLR